MKKILTIFMVLCILLLTGCSEMTTESQIVATTRPVYDLTALLCKDTNISVELLVSENLSCLHDYTLQVSQMRAIESAELIVMSGAGLEDFLADVLTDKHSVIDASGGISLLCGDHDHDHGDHPHHEDPHIWLSITNTRAMAENICSGLMTQYPQHRDALQKNYVHLLSELDELDTYGKQAFSALESRNLITFHDGFGYFADYWDLNILHSLEEESGSEASAAELKDIINIIRQNNITAIFVEENGSASAASIIAAETGVSVYRLNMGMSDKGFLEAMYQNINTIKEALG